MKISKIGAISSASICCCFLIFVVMFFGGTSSDNSGSTTDIVVGNNTVEEKSLPILNMTNTTLKDYKITFIYYDHNTSSFEGCYGLNYTVLSDREGNNYMLDHATTDILGEKTNYTFRYPDGITLIFDNNTETEIFNKSSLYYIHEIQDENNTVIKSLGNFTLYDKSHEPTFIPTNWTFYYSDHTSSEYEGDYGLWEARTNNSIGNHEQNVSFSDRMVNGLMYYSNNSTDFYRYGFNGEVFDDLEKYHKDWGYSLDMSLTLPNGTKIKAFNIESSYLAPGERNFLMDFQIRRDEYFKRKEINAIYEAQDDEYDDYVRYHESQNTKTQYSTYSGTNGMELLDLINPLFFLML